ncbi:FeoA family protein [Desulfurispora thermophila]|uniref:FeoA family protein n=1 Tax=Desulfurispora thermophila TaxID=265470 RepID=UPI00037A74E7|nr:FeoA family protein [Desulfurispora thermophila]
MITLKDLRPGESGTVQQLLVSGQERGRFMAMGLIKGALVKVIRLAPLGDPMEVEVKSYRLSLRRAEAAQIMVIPHTRERGK